MEVLLSGGDAAKDAEADEAAAALSLLAVKAEEEGEFCFAAYFPSSAVPKIFITPTF